MLILPMLLLPTPAVAPTPRDAATAAVDAAMADSAAGWNAGDMRRFLAIYADDAVLVTKDGLVRGKAAIAARYDKGYGRDAARRGRLSFRMLGQRAIDPTHRMLWARWRLDHAGGKVDSGMTSLLFERQQGGWKIMSDHSS